MPGYILYPGYKYGYISIKVVMAILGSMNPMLELFDSPERVWLPCLWGWLSTAGETESQHLHLTKEDLLSKENGQCGYA